jgi:hypothetical protein
MYIKYFGGGWAGLFRGFSQQNAGDEPNVRFAPCVDGSPLARVFLMFCPSVGAAMCAACLCGTKAAGHNAFR